MASEFRYRAFISYSHTDEAWAKWLHQKLERYRVPSRLVGRQTGRGIVQRRIGRCFRDQAELSAASHLGETLKQALKDSEALIIVCSPRAAASHWVNEEIRYYRTLGRSNHLYALIVDGEPKAKDAAQECFPPALLRGDDGRAHEDPLAADAREGRDGKSDGFLKLVAGLLGVGFDDLRRREQRRRTRLALAAVGASLGIAVLTTVLAVSAYRAQNEAEAQRNEAQLRRAQADDLIDFMLGDLQDRLSQADRLDLLDPVLDKTLKYLGAEPGKEQDDTLLLQRARALGQVSDILNLRGRNEPAAAAADQAVAAVRAVLQRRPDDPDVEQAMAQALFFRAQPQGASSAAGLADLRKALALIEHRLAQRPDDTARLLHAVIEARLYQSYRAAEPPLPADEANAYAANCARELRPLAQRAASKTIVVATYLQCASQMARGQLESGAADRAADSYVALVKEIPALVALHPGDHSLEQVVSISLAAAAQLLTAAGRYAPAEAMARSAIDAGRPMVERDPTNVDKRQSLSYAHLFAASTVALRHDWTATLRYADGAIEAIGNDAAKAAGPDNFARHCLQRGHDYRAMALLGQGRIADATAEWQTVVELGRGSTKTIMRLNAVNAGLRLRELLEHSDPARARQAGEAARAELQAVMANPVPKYAEDFLLEHRMRLAYLDGDATAGDSLYTQLREQKAANIPFATETRHRLCQRLALVRGQRCGSIEEWRPPRGGDTP